MERNIFKIRHISWKLRRLNCI